MNNDGFTLIEVLAALLIFSLAIIGLTRSSIESIRTASVLQDKSYAGIVADNQIVKFKILPLKSGVITGEDTVMGTNYDWRAEVSKTQSKDFYEIKVEVIDKATEQLIIKRTAFRLAKL